MTKNQTIAYLLENFEKNLRSAAANISEIRRCLLEPEKVPSPLLNKTAADVPPKCQPIKIRSDWKEEMTAAINERNRQAVESAKASQTVVDKLKTVTVQVNPADIVSIPKTDVLNNVKLIGLTPAQVNNFGFSLTLVRVTRGSNIYKINQGNHIGAIVKASRKTGKINVDGRYGFNRGGSLNYTNHIAIVSCDKDGKAYVNNVIRKALNKNGKRVKLSRIYRPRGFAGKFLYCDLYKQPTY